MTTLVSFLLDRTGSMESIKTDTIGSFNTYLEGLKAGDTDIKFSMSQFDSDRGTQETYTRINIKEVKKLTTEDYKPFGGTNLIDAAYQLIKNTESFVDSQMIKPKVIIVIQTDGEENASREHTWEQLNSLIKSKQEIGWQFNFMGAGIDAYKQSQRMGISALNTVSYSKDAGATRAAYMNLSHNHTAFAAGATMDVAFSAEQKLQAKDQFVPK